MEFKISEQPVPYLTALSEMEERVEKIITGHAEELIWFLEHEDVYTGGTSANESDLLNTGSIPVYNTGRGGKFTYHGPGQRICYLILDLKKHHEKPDVRLFVRQLEDLVINTLADFNIKGFTREGRVGVWVNTPKGESKIAALGIRIRKWVTFHGIAINLAPDLAKFRGIVPCGISNQQFGVTSFSELGLTTRMEELDMMLEKNLNNTFGLFR